MSSKSNPWTITARWVFPADRLPLSRGTITIQGDKILAVEPAGTRTAETDLGNVAILPGLVNAHTHLDLSDARGKIPPGAEFTKWLRGVIEFRKAQTAEQVRSAIAKGIQECISHGVLNLGDISVGGTSAEALGDSKMRAIVFYEMTGLTEERVAGAMRDAQCWGENWRKSLGKKNIFPNYLAGLSPHAPYSVSRSFFQQLAQLYKRMAVPLAIHLAETTGEIELIQSSGGPFVPFLNELGLGGHQELVPSVAGLIDLFRHGFHVLWVHCNYLPPETPLPTTHTIVYCPRTHAAFGHPPHPFREFLKRGVRVVLGTDSLASNPDLDILAEARFVAARHPDLPGETLLRMITLDGAIALGWGDVAGSLTTGKSADLVMLPLPDREENDPHRLVFESTDPVQRVMFRGKWILEH